MQSSNQLVKKNMQNRISKTKGNYKSIGRIVLLIVISLVIGIKLYSWNAKTLAGNEMPMPFGWGVSVVLSGSMEPELSVDDLVIVREQSSYELKDVVVYQDGNSLVIHKIISIDGDEVITKGEANNIADPPVKLSNIKGKAVAHIPLAGAAVRFLKSPLGFILVIAAAIVLFELPYMRERKKITENQERIKEEIRRLKGE